MRKAAPKTETVKVEIEADESKPHGVRFEFDKWGKKDRLEFENDGHDGVLVSFVIKDRDGTGLLFPKAPDQALWARTIEQESDPCPREGEQWDQFVPLMVAPTQNILIVENKNREKQLFKFCLNFTKPGYDGLVPWDPIGENRNG